MPNAEENEIQSETRPSNQNHWLLEQITMLCSPSTSGALRLTLRTDGLPFVLSGAKSKQGCRIKSGMTST